MRRVKVWRDDEPWIRQVGVSAAGEHIFELVAGRVTLIGTLETIMTLCRRCGGTVQLPRMIINLN